MKPVTTRHKLPAEYQHALLSHDLTPEHRRAVVMMIHWLDLLPNYFPTLHHRPDPTKDPRKTHIFKCCLKALRILGPNFPDSSIRIFVKSQIQIMSAAEGNSVVITPECLCGVKSKDRFEMWKKLLEERMVNSISSEESTPELMNILGVLKNSHRNMMARGGLKKVLSEDLAKVARWVRVQVVDPLYIYLHPDSEQVAKSVGWVSLGVDEEKVKPLANQLVRRTMQEIIK